VGAGNLNSLRTGSLGNPHQYHPQQNAYNMTEWHDYTHQDAVMKDENLGSGGGSWLDNRFGLGRDGRSARWRTSSILTRLAGSTGSERTKPVLVISSMSGLDCSRIFTFHSLRFLGRRKRQLLFCSAESSHSNTCDNAHPLLRASPRPWPTFNFLPSQPSFTSKLFILLITIRFLILHILPKIYGILPFSRDLRLEAKNLSFHFLRRGLSCMRRISRRLFWFRLERLLNGGRDLKLVGGSFQRYLFICLIGLAIHTLLLHCSAYSLGWIWFDSWLVGLLFWWMQMLCAWFLLG